MLYISDLHTNLKAYLINKAHSIDNYSWKNYELVFTLNQNIKFGMFSTYKFKSETIHILKVIYLK